MISRKVEELPYGPGSIGSLHPGVYCKVVNPESGRTCGPNEHGELWFRGKHIMKGYLANAKATAETIDADGWLHSGDIGYYDEKKHFFLVDRLKELIKYKGFQVPPAQLEGILLGHPAVRDAAVIGIPDAFCGELPTAFVVKQPNVKVTEKELIDFVTSKVTEYKRLRGGLQFIAMIPRNPNGKILRRQLRKLTTVPQSKL